MSRMNDEQRETLAFIDAIVSLTEDSDIFDMFRNLNLNLSLNPFAYLLSIIERKVSMDEIVDWLANILTTGLPAIELGVKGVLLSNLKQTIDCNNDPRIPEWMRKDPFENRVNGNNVTTSPRGIAFNVNNLDYRGILRESPFTAAGSRFYLGTGEYYTFREGKLAGKKYYSYSDIYRDAFVNATMGTNTDDLSIVKYTEDVTGAGTPRQSKYELARAKDFNAFLWFAINEAHFTDTIKIQGPIASPKLINGVQPPRPPQTLPYTLESGYSTLTVNKMTSDIDIAQEKYPIFFAGSAMVQSINSSTDYINSISLCIKDEYEGSNDGSTSANQMAKAQQAMNKSQHTYTFIPVSNNDKSVNWYVNKGTYFNFLRPQKNRKLRNYEEDVALCNIEYITQQNARVSTYSLSKIDDYIRFTILPAPFVHLPIITKKKGDIIVNGKKNTVIDFNGEPFYRIQRILFNSKGDMDKKGRYTVYPATGGEGDVTYQDNKCIYNHIFNVSNNAGTEIRGLKLEIYADSGNYRLVKYNDVGQEIPTNPIGDETIASALIECYPGLTVYDFNYNFVMGMQLFDPPVVARQLIEMATNIIAGPGTIQLGFGLNTTETAYQMRIAEIVKQIIEVDAAEVDDCFFTFSNDKYNEMLHKAELKRASGYEFQTDKNRSTRVSIDEAYAELNSFNDNATLHENKEVIKRAITKATASITEEILPEDKVSVQFNIVSQLISGLVFSITSSLLTPKIVLLFEVNKRLMGGHDENLDIEDFIESIIGLITGIIKEIRDLILRELLNWVLNILRDLIEKLAKTLVLEQVEYYTRLMRALLKVCSFKIKSRTPLQNHLDNVDYADIDDVQQPPSEECQTN